MATKEVSENKDEFYGQQKYVYPSGKQKVAYNPRVVWLFLQHVLSERKLLIGDIFPQLFEKSFFLVAGTGLGKTLAVPLWLLFRKMYYENERPPSLESGKPFSAVSPRVWVVEPRIAICQGLQAEMNRQWHAWSLQTYKKPCPPFFGVKTKVDHAGTDAPIIFITTGIFAIYARKGFFEAGRDIVLIDEAHETLEADEGVELGVAICRMTKVNIHFMSATVDTRSIEQQLGAKLVIASGARQPLWRCNVQRPLQECVVDIVDQALVRPRTEGMYFPSRMLPDADVIIRSVTEQGRAKGILIIINSFSSERSDARRVEQLLHKAFTSDQIEIGLLASEVLKNPKRKVAYESMLQRWKKEKRKYVLIATSVVEMGVTLPDLDFVVTMDAGFKREVLGINALIQRIGRVGRQRPGIAYITQEIGASYTKLTNEELNRPEAFTAQPIQFPMRKGSLETLAYFTLKNGWTWPFTAQRLLTDFFVASFQLMEIGDWQNRLFAERHKLLRLEIATETADGSGLTSLGIRVERWVGRVPLEIATRIHRAWSKKMYQASYFVLAEAALSQMDRDRLLPVFQTNQSISNHDWNAIILLLRQTVVSIDTLRRRRIYHSFALQEYVERMLEQGAQYGIQWTGLTEFISIFAELLPIFARSVLEDGDTDSQNVFERWQESLRWFIRCLGDDA